MTLPTGLGKTFIAAVVMRNFWRWFPTGLVLFLAPTRPLVNQQVDACHQSAGLPENDAVELTGSIKPAQRAALWASKRVAFATPQVVENDLASGRLDARRIVCRAGEA